MSVVTLLPLISLKSALRGFPIDILVFLMDDVSVGVEIEYMGSSGIPRAHVPTECGVHYRAGGSERIGISGSIFNDHPTT